MTREHPTFQALLDAVSVKPEDRTVIFDFLKSILQKLRLETDDAIMLKAYARIEKVLHDIPPPKEIEYEDLDKAPEY